MMTTKEIAAMRDKLAAEMPQANEYRFLTIDDLFAFVGMEPSASFAKQVAAGVKAQAKIRYMYADAMMEARKSSKEGAEEPVAGEDGWIPYDGGGMPCDKDQKVQIRVRDGMEDTYSAEAGLWDWEVDGSETDIIAWRPAK